MNDATAPVRHWQRLLTPFGFVLTQPGYARFAQWVTGTALAWEEHAITQVLASVGLEDRWRVAERFAEYGAFRRDAVERQTRRLIEAEATPRFGGYRVTGPTEPVRVLAVEVEGYADPWFLVTTSASLTAAEVVEVFAARFRQEAGFRDHKQRLGMEECRAWTEAPVERTFAVQVVTQTLLRLLGRRLDRASGADGWWSPPAWNRHKSHPSLLDVRRAVWATRAEFSDFLRRLDGREE